ncbi:cyclic nucleotide-binding domain-containing protein [Rhodobacterales bacterium HKCCE2091]|nr:cyclic nucleotide-binding domain-containing protein [Rhodobacterales bacterium HKCCE2091]
MKTRCQFCPLRQKELFVPMTPEEVAATQKFKVGEMSIAARTPILMEGANSAQLFTVLSGMGLRYKLLADGSRQIVNFVLPGDFIGLQASVMGEMAHTVEASTDMRLCVFDRTEFWTFFRAHPERAYDLTWLAAVEERFLGEALTALGQRPALPRIVWALLTIWERARLVDLTEGPSMPFPWRQQDLADALGLSLVHTNKTLARLRQSQLLTLSPGKLTVHDPEALRRTAGIEEVEVPQRPIL